MKHTLFILALITATIHTFAQSPRIKLNQITKDSVTGSVLVSSPTDSGMVYSRDLYISYGADTVLILGGDTLAATSGIISSVLSDGVTIIGNGTIGSELTADTSVLATLRALSDSLALVISSVTADNVTITGDGTVGSPLVVDTSTVVASVGRLLDSLINVRTDLDLKQDQLNGTGFVKATGTTISYDNSTYLTSEVDGSVTNEIQDISTTGAAGNISISDGSTLNLNVDDADASASNEGSLTVGAGTASTSVISSNTSGSTDVTLTAGTNVTLSESGNNITIAATGGGSSFNNISETADTVYISDYLDVDTATLYVDAVENRVGIGTSSPKHTLHIDRNVTDTVRALLIGDTPTYPDRNVIVEIGGTHEMNHNGTAFTFAPNLKNTNTSNGFYGYGINTNVDLQQNLSLYYNFLSIQTVKTNGYTLTDLSNAFYRNDFFSSTGAVTNSNVVDVLTPYIYSGAIKPTNQYGFRIRNQGVSGITNSYGLYIDSQSGASNSYPLYIGNFTSGTLSASSGIITASSDQRLKNEDGYVEYGIEKINQLIPRYFYWKDQEMGLNRQIGFYAQEVNTIIPEAAPAPNDGEYWGLYDRGLIAVTVKAIQEQQAIIESQATEIETLKTLITELSNRLQILENN